MLEFPALTAPPLSVGGTTPPFTCQIFLSSLWSSVSPPNASTPMLPRYSLSWPTFPAHKATLTALKNFSSFLKSIVFLPLLPKPTKSFPISYWISKKTEPTASLSLRLLTASQGTNSTPYFPLVSHVPPTMFPLLPVTLPELAFSVAKLDLSHKWKFLGVSSPPLGAVQTSLIRVIEGRSPPPKWQWSAWDVSVQISPICSCGTLLGSRLVWPLFKNWSVLITWRTVTIYWNVHTFWSIGVFEASLWPFFSWEFFLDNCNNSTTT